MDRHPTLLDRATSVLIMIDAQEAFLNVMHGRDALVGNLTLLTKAATILGVPILATTQNAARLGSVLPALVPHPRNREPLPIVDKMSFSCCGSELFVQTLAGLDRKQVVICGLETHICVSQTAHDLLHAGYQVHVTADGVSSRTLEKHKLGMERIRDAGILPCASEAAVYEWMREAGTPEFKEILSLVK